MVKNFLVRRPFIDVIGDAKAVSTHSHLVLLLSCPAEMGEGARRRLQLFASNFEHRLNPNAPKKQQRGSLQEASGAAAERRGLLDDDDGEDVIEFEMKKSN